MNKQILRLAIPNIITNITVPLLGMVDTAIVGHLNNGDGADYIGAIAVGTMIFNIIYSFSYHCITICDICIWKMHTIR